MWRLCVLQITFFPISFLHNGRSVLISSLEVNLVKLYS
uniref:Uncharacterized protein n=1 Tax=Lepeophtheirus salmonis TaxID=72036 RepID=A0A0K2UT29_LEPSM